MAVGLHVRFASVAVEDSSVGRVLTTDKRIDSDKTKTWVVNLDCEADGRILGVAESVKAWGGKICNMRESVAYPVA